MYWIEKFLFPLVVRIVQSKTAMAAVAIVVVAVSVVYGLGKAVVPHDESLTLSKGGQRIDDIVFSYDGTRMAYAEIPKHILYGMEVATQLGDKPEGETWLVVKPLDGEAKKIFHICDGSTNVEVAWRPGHDELTFWTYRMGDDDTAQGRIYRISAEGGKAEKYVGGSRHFAWSRQGRYLAYCKSRYHSDDEAGLYVLDAESDMETQVVALECENPRWSPVADEVVFQGKYDYGNLKSDKYNAAMQANGPRPERYFGDVYMYDAGRDAMTRLTQDGNHVRPLFSGDGQKVTAWTRDLSVPSLDERIVIMNRDGSQPTTLVAQDEQVQSFADLCHSPDGQWLYFTGFFQNPKMRKPKSPKDLYASGENRVFDIFRIRLTGGERERLESGKFDYKRRPQFSPDGRIFAYRVEYADMNTEFWHRDSERLDP